MDDYFENYDDLFINKGWLQLEEELKENKEAISSIEAVKDVNDLYFRKGQLNIIAYILNLKATLDASRDE